MLQQNIFLRWFVIVWLSVSITNSKNWLWFSMNNIEKQQLLLGNPNFKPLYIVLYNCNYALYLQ